MDMLPQDSRNKKCSNPECRELTTDVFYYTQNFRYCSEECQSEHLRLLKRHNALPETRETE